jgi:hypothetical protein
MRGAQSQAPDNFSADYFEVEWGVLSSETSEPDEPASFQPLPALPSPGARFRRLVLTGSLLLLALLVVISLVSRQIASAPAASKTRPYWAGVPLLVNPLPAPLGAVPQLCLQGPTPRSISPAIRPVLGGAPVWVAGFDGPHATLHIPDPSAATYTRYGWIEDLLWEVGPNYPEPVIIRGENLRDGAPLWLRMDNQAITTLLVLNPGAPHAVSSLGKAWAEWWVSVYISLAGCYALKVSWPGGAWQIIFAAGRGGEQISSPGHNE